MALAEYKRKRKFNKSLEPSGGKSADHTLHFVVQKHAASSLHYDFRLEMSGVLKSWAIPKGPSMNPGHKRLAMLVEDHPYHYKNFEGIIPKGNYGAGTVMVWDEGTYEPQEKTKSKTDSEKLLLNDFQAGSLKIKLKGKKLKGEFVLIRTPKRAENAWLLIKQKDAHATDEDVVMKDKSVMSGKTLAEISEPVTKNNKTNAKVKRSNSDSSTHKNRERLPGRKRTTGKVRGKGKSLLQPEGEKQIVKVDGHNLTFTNLSKVFWPDENITKRDMLNYYDEVAPYMLPYMKDRPQTLHRHPNGIKGKSFYQKDVTGKVPDWIEKYEYHTEADERKKHFMVCTNAASLLYIASLGCIELNPWSSTTQSPDNPDWCIIDLDPDKNGFDEVIETALVTKQMLDAMKVSSFCKTSGSTGIHIYIPLGAKYSYDESKAFARTIVTMVHDELPEITSMERARSKRPGKIYLDFLQNQQQATVAAPYSLRPKPNAPVSMPLHWDELTKGLKISDFNIDNTIARLKKEGDLFKGVLGKGADIVKALKKIEPVTG